MRERGRQRPIIGRLRRSSEALSRGDFDQAIEVAHPEIEYVPVGGQSPLKGAKALRGWMEPDAFESLRVEPREIHVHGDKVLVQQHSWARGAGSGIEMELDTWAVWTVNREGL